MSTIILELGDSEARKVTEAVDLYGFASETELAREALHRFLDSHTPDLKEKYVMQDIEWALHGQD
jgi:Arc/MetJ-type ribon-helix-helix transcriptional regulator